MRLAVRARQCFWNPCPGRNIHFNKHPTAQLYLMIFKVFSNLNDSMILLTTVQLRVCFYHRSKLQIISPAENQVLITTVSPHYTNSSITGPVTPCSNTGLQQQGIFPVGRDSHSPGCSSPSTFTYTFPSGVPSCHRPPAC